MITRARTEDEASITRLRVRSGRRGPIASPARSRVSRRQGTSSTCRCRTARAKRVGAVGRDPEPHGKSALEGPICATKRGGQPRATECGSRSAIATHGLTCSSYASYSSSDTPAPCSWSRTGRCTTSHHIGRTTHYRINDRKGILLRPARVPEKGLPVSAILGGRTGLKLPSTPAANGRHAAVIDNVSRRIGVRKPRASRSVCPGRQGLAYPSELVRSAAPSIGGHAGVRRRIVHAHHPGRVLRWWPESGCRRAERC